MCIRDRPKLQGLDCKIEQVSADKVKADGIIGRTGTGLSLIHISCMEGLGYFTYGMTYYTGFADMLYRYTDGAIDLMEDEKCRRIATVSYTHLDVYKRQMGNCRKA